MLNKYMGKTCFVMCITTVFLMSACGQNINKENTENFTDEETVKEIVEETIVEETQDDVDTTNVITEDEQKEEIEETQEEISEVDAREEKRVKVKGIYVSGPVAGISRMDELISLVDETELNAMVIDIKNDEGKVTYQMESPMVTEIGSSIGYIKDIDALIQKCKEKNIYLIARIVAFKDPVLAEEKPELAIHYKDGSIYRDNAGLAWVNPYETEVWEYLKEIGIDAANKGFDEIQYDYIRFSTDISDSKVDYGENAINKSKIDIITEFTEYITEALKPYDVFVAADVYGTIIDSEVDQRIVGQNYVEMASILDYICPMVYPSHYANGVYGIAIPDANPYGTVNAAMNAASKQLEKIDDENNRAINRVWIQSFTASWVDGHISYGPAEIRAQIKGAYDAGYDEWILWNAAMKYQRDSLLTDEEAAEEKDSWDEELAQKKESEEKVTDQESDESQEEQIQENIDDSTEEIQEQTEKE